MSRLLGAGPALRMTAIDPVAAAAPDPGFAIALIDNSRNNIAARSDATPPLAARAELTCLGGSLTATGAWDGFSWTHAAALGRDQSVRVLEEGRLYPWGARATLITTVERQPKDLGAGGVAALRAERTLRIADPVLPSTAQRTFPFDIVELLHAEITGLGADEDAYSFIRPSPHLADTEAELAAATQALSDQLGPLGGKLGLPRSPDDVVRSGFPAAQTWAEAKGQLAGKGQELADDDTARAAVDALQNQIDDIERRIRQIPDQIQGTDGPEPNPEVDELAQQSAELSAQMRGIFTLGNQQRSALVAEVQRLTVVVDQSFAAMGPELQLPSLVVRPRQRRDRGRVGRTRPATGGRSTHAAPRHTRPSRSRSRSSSGRHEPTASGCAFRCACTVRPRSTSSCR